MGSQANFHAQIIPLPQCDGALRRLVEKFSSDLHAGTANSIIPIAVRPGRNGFQPQLKRPFWVWWALGIPGIPGITRMASYGTDHHSTCPKR